MKGRVPWPGKSFERARERPHERNHAKKYLKSWCFEVCRGISVKKLINHIFGRNYWHFLGETTDILTHIINIQYICACVCFCVTLAKKDWCNVCGPIQSFLRPHILIKTHSFGNVKCQKKQYGNDEKLTALVAKNHFVTMLSHNKMGF